MTIAVPLCYAQDPGANPAVNQLLKQIEEYRQQQKTQENTSSSNEPENPPVRSTATGQRPMSSTNQLSNPAFQQQIQQLPQRRFSTPSQSGYAPGVPIGVDSREVVNISKAYDEEKRIDLLDLKNMSVQDFLKLISKKTGLNIVTGTNVQGQVTIYLKDVNVYDALRIILEANDLAYAEENNIIKVMTGADFQVRYGFKFGADVRTVIVKLEHANALDMVTVLNQVKSNTGKVVFDLKSNTLVLADNPDSLRVMQELIQRIDLPIQTEIFDLSYAPVKDISEKLTETLTPNVGRLKSDERSNRIVVTDTPSKIREIEKIVKAFDVKEEEVLIEARILQIVLSDQYEMGVDWEGIVQEYHQLDLAGDFDVLTSSDKKGTLSIGTIASDEYTFLIEALETIGDTNILSKPSITALNNIEAKILVGSTQPYVTSTTTTPSSGPTTTAETVNFIDVGVKLFVTPTIHHDGFVTMKIKPEVSSVTSTLTTSNNNTIPVVETSEAETTVTVKDNVTIVIGGLIKDEEISSFKKIPLLGDIPILGMAFRNQDSLLKKTELVIFLTPKIITGDVQQEHRVAEMIEDYKAIPRSYPVRKGIDVIDKIFP